MDLTNKTLSELRAIADEWGITPTGHRGHKQTWILAIEAAICDRKEAASAILSEGFANENSPGVESQDSDITAYFTDDRPPNRGEERGGRVENEAIGLSLPSMREWAPCPEEWWTVETNETTSITSNFFILTFDDRNSEDSPTAGSFARLPTSPKGFPPTNSVAKFARTKTTSSGRSPPGGDA
jgi:hypothetical protein